jgi:hypothetical protein
VGGGRHRVSRGWKAVLLACQRLWLATRGRCFLHRPHCCIQEEVVCSSRISRKLSQTVKGFRVRVPSLFGLITNFFSLGQLGTSSPAPPLPQAARRGLREIHLHASHRQ